MVVTSPRLVIFGFYLVPQAHYSVAKAHELLIAVVYFFVEGVRIGNSVCAFVPLPFLGFSTRVLALLARWGFLMSFNDFAIFLMFFAYIFISFIHENLVSGIMGHLLVIFIGHLQVFDFGLKCNHFLMGFAVVPVDFLINIFRNQAEHFLEMLTQNL